MFSHLRAFACWAKAEIVLSGFYARIYVVVLSIFSAHRVILSAVEWEKMQRASVWQYAQALFMGVRFDIVVTCYVLILPLVLIAAAGAWGTVKGPAMRLFRWYVAVAFGMAFFVSVADIPYTGQFNSRMSVSAFEWADTPGFVLGLVVGEPRYWAYIALYVATMVIFLFDTKKIFARHAEIEKSRSIVGRLVVTVFMALLLVVGIRGRLEQKSPIRVGTASFCCIPFLNQLGLNPNFTLLRSYLDSQKPENKSIELMPSAEALAYVQRMLGIQPSPDRHPLFRRVDFNGAPKNKRNVVIVLMESMSAAKMARHGNSDSLTPFFDSLSRAGIYFENCYSSGIHTFNGIFSTIFSHPAIFRQHPMKESGARHIPNLAAALQKHGYATAYFTTHDAQFDNVEGFLRDNGFGDIYSNADYPEEATKSVMGIPDDVFFEYAILTITKIYNSGTPFLSVLMTGSDHGPFYVPDYFQSPHRSLQKRATQYADYSLQKFMDMARRQPWFSNTIFVFVADHGVPTDAVYPLAINHVHVPLLFYIPNREYDARTVSLPASQIDVFPTVMGLLQLPYKDMSMGVDLLRRSRRFALSNADDRYAVFDSEWMLLVGESGDVSLYRFRHGDTVDYAAAQASRVAEMKIFGDSHLQAYQYLINNVYR